MLKKQIFMKKINWVKRWGVFVLLATLILISCKNDKQEQKNSKQNKNTSTEEKYTEQEIAAVLIDVQKTTHLMTELGEKKLRNDEVKRKIQQQQTSAEGLTRKTREMLEFLEIKGEKTALTEDMITDFKKRYNTLEEEVDEKHFDAIYLENSIAYKKGLMKLFGDEILPNCHDDEFCDLVKASHQLLSNQIKNETNLKNNL